MNNKKFQEDIDSLIKWLKEAPIAEYCLMDMNLKNKLKELEKLINEYLTRENKKSLKKFKTQELIEEIKTRSLDTKITGMLCNSKKLIEIKSGIIELRIYPCDVWYAHYSNTKNKIIVERNTTRIIISKQEFNEKFILKGQKKMEELK